MRKLYDFELSGNCYKVRLYLSMLGLDYEKVPVDLRAGEHRQDWYRRINPLGKVPVLDDGGTVLRDSSAILVYLAAKHGGEAWYPREADSIAEVQQWLSLAVNEVFNGLAVARAIVLFGRPGDLAAAQALSREVLALLEGRLAGNEWLACGRPTVADIACYPYVALAELGQVPLAPFGAVRGWLARVAALPGYVAPPGPASSG